MDEDFKWIAVAIAFVFGSLFACLFISDYLRHTEKMECISQRGEFMRDTCIFRDAKPPQ